ncbi:hypothetical protein I305_01962 [Cryptococcus gattii E566]|uniref:Uncharacterized protein n=2 Tax=Cryptococcus gattii TaxID=37769 RepID=E6R4C8_CRYGW|nr:Hypothetical protein CGB_D6260W [Cryptococcus gattii WM276]ADV21928.1 Hypothetical protein CGB_D6260W [Cryptococcus gattii WM276]KIR80853.1 hypothetical protein I306_02310 [Cryptococcus gattii EJB2]KIY35711.1 hypothetical protein I305_01962 [Cryptococcus gattii E566]KJE03380.1 hypothetical protein I311_02942 [Cryptococcus gattii NT-10]
MSPHSFDPLFRLLIPPLMFSIRHNPIMLLHHLIKHAQFPLHRASLLLELLFLNPIRNPVDSLAQNR